MRSGPIGRLAQQNGIAKARALLFQVIEEAARPDEFGREDAERQNNREPARAGSHDHDDPQGEQSEPEENLQEPLRLLERLY